MGVDRAAATGGVAPRGGLRGQAAQELRGGTSGLEAVPQRRGARRAAAQMTSDAGRFVGGALVGHIGQELTQHVRMGGLSSLRSFTPSEQRRRPDQARGLHAYYRFSVPLLLVPLTCGVYSVWWSWTEEPVRQS